MKTVRLLGGPADGQRVEVHGTMLAIEWSEILPFDGVTRPTGKTHRYQVAPMCSHGEVHWFGVLDGADPLALLIAGYPARAGLVELLDRFDSEIRNEYDGTCMLEERLAEVDHLRELAK